MEEKKKDLDQSEVYRILKLPSFTPTIKDFTTELKTTNGSMQLRKVQNEALTVASSSKGMVGLIGCGHGKTLISLLLPQVMKKKNLSFSCRLL